MSDDIKIISKSLGSIASNLWWIAFWLFCIAMNTCSTGEDIGESLKSAYEEIQEEESNND